MVNFAVDGWLGPEISIELKNRQGRFHCCADSGGAGMNGGISGERQQQSCENQEPPAKTGDRTLHVRSLIQAYLSSVLIRRHANWQRVVKELPPMGAGDGNRTRIASLEGWSSSH